jgi:hypothetical protein
MIDPVPQVEIDEPLLLITGTMSTWHNASDVRAQWEDHCGEGSLATHPGQGWRAYSLLQDLNSLIVLS